MLGDILATCPKMASRRLLMLTITGRRPVCAAISSFMIISMLVFQTRNVIYRIGNKEWHGSGISGTTAVTAVLPRELGRNSRYYRGSGSRIHGIPAVMGETNSYIFRSVYQIDMKFDRQLRPATETSWVVSYNGKTFPRWRTAAILKFDISPYFSEKSSDSHVVHSSRFWTGWTSRDQNWESCIGQTPSSTERILVCMKLVNVLAQVGMGMNELHGDGENSVGMGWGWGRYLLPCHSLVGNRIPACTLCDCELTHSQSQVVLISKPT